MKKRNRNKEKNAAKRNNEVVRRPKLRWWLVGGCVLTLTLIIGAGLMRWRRADQSKYVVRMPPAVQQYLAMVAKRPPDRWWLSQPVDPGDTSAIQTIFNKEGQVAKLFSRYRTTSPLAQRVAELQLKPSVYAPGGYSVFLFAGSDPQEMVKRLGTGIEICFIPQGLFRQNSFPAALYYRKEWGALMLAGLDYPEPVLASLLFHEAGHALRDRVDHAPAASAPQGSDAYCDEEVEMHELEEAVLNAATKGAYGRALDRILDQGSVNSLGEAVGLLTTTDLETLSEVVGAQDAGLEVHQTLIAEFMLTLGFHWIDRQPGGNAAYAKRQFYRSLTKSQQ